MQNGRIPFSPGRLACSWTPEEANPVMEICGDGFTACSRCTFPGGREMNKVLMVNGLTFGPPAVTKLPRRRAAQASGNQLNAIRSHSECVRHAVPQHPRPPSSSSSSSSAARGSRIQSRDVAPPLPLLIPNVSQLTGCHAGLTSHSARCYCSLPHACC